MMNLDNYYLHATGGYHGIYNNKNTVLDILQDRKIKVSINKNYKHSPIDKICLCDVTKPELYDDYTNAPLESSLMSFVRYSPSLAFSRNLKVETPIYCFRVLDAIEEKADCYDEVRYNGDLSLEHLKFITFPIWPHNGAIPMRIPGMINNLLIFKQNIEIISKEYKKVPTKDLYTGKDITADDVDRQIEVFQKKLK